MSLYEKLLEHKNKTFTVEELKLKSKINDYDKEILKSSRKQSLKVLC